MKREWNIDQCTAVWNGMSESELEIIDRAHEKVMEEEEIEEETVKVPVSLVNSVLAKIMKDDVEELKQAAVEIIARIEKL